jgi:hypothetical protein
VCNQLPNRRLFPPISGNQLHAWFAKNLIQVNEITWKIVSEGRGLILAVKNGSYPGENKLQKLYEALFGSQ